MVLLEWNYYDQEVAEDASLWEDVEEHLREMVSSLATYCPKLAQVNFLSMEEHSVISLNMERREGRCEIIATSCSDFEDSICTSAWKGKYSDL